MCVNQERLQQAGLEALGAETQNNGDTHPQYPLTNQLTLGVRYPPGTGRDVLASQHPQMSFMNTFFFTSRVLQTTSLVPASFMFLFSRELQGFFTSLFFLLPCLSRVFLASPKASFGVCTLHPNECPFPIRKHAGKRQTLSLAKFPHLVLPDSFTGSWENRSFSLFTLPPNIAAEVK